MLHVASTVLKLLSPVLGGSVLATLIMLAMLKAILYPWCHLLTIKGVLMGLGLLTG